MFAKDNPFATDRVERLLAFEPGWSGTSWQELDERWHRLGCRVSVVGPHGAGKTTFLDAWEQRLSDGGQRVIRLTLNSARRKFTEDDLHRLGQAEGSIVILDGAGVSGFRISRILQKYTRNSAGLLVTRHRESGNLPVLLRLVPGIDCVERCVRKLAPDCYMKLSPRLPDWWEHCNGNIRDILLRCYDEVASQ